MNYSFKVDTFVLHFIIVYLECDQVFMFVRYSSQAGEDCTLLTDAIKMLMDLRRTAEDKMSMHNIVGYPGDLDSLGQIIRHVGPLLTRLQGQMFTPVKH